MEELVVRAIHAMEDHIQPLNLLKSFIGMMRRKKKL